MRCKKRRRNGGTGLLILPLALLFLARPLAVSAGAEASNAPPSRPLDPSARLQEIDRDWARLESEKAGLTALLDGHRAELTAIQEALAKEDAEYERLRARLVQIEAEAGKLRAELDRRTESVSRHADKAVKYRTTLERLEVIQGLQRKLQLERYALVSRTSGGEKGTGPAAPPPGK